MEIKVLFIGDVVGSIGRQGVAKLLPKLKQKYQPDLVIANAENLAHGLGVTESTLTEILNAGVDYCTGGNHIFDRPGNEKLLNEEKWRLLRPANYPAGSDGVGEKVINISPPRLAVGEAGP
ncbi:MAG: YmdB family metallophosphoesterase, partial [Patescibacteria group bacterium]